MKTFLKNNINFFVYFIFSILIELITLYSITKNFFISSPWLSLCLLGIIFSIYNFLKSRTAKNVVLFVVSAIQTMICLFCYILFDSTGTLFEFSMFRLVAEATTFAGVISPDYFVIVLIAAIYIIFLLLISHFNKYTDKHYRVKLSVLTA